MSWLTIEGLVAGYVRGVDILNGVSLEVQAHTITGVIGPNGAGKSTLLKTLFGLLSPTSGRICFDGIAVQGQTPAALKRYGISYVPQGLNIFPHLTVEENLRLACWTVRRDPRRLHTAMAYAYDLFPVLQKKRRSKASLLSGGEAKMLSLAKEVMLQPRLLLVDEPSAGLAPKITDYVYHFLDQSLQSGVTILLVDQNVSKAVEVSHYLYMLEMGTVKLHGPQAYFRTNVRTIIRDSLIGT